MIRTFIALPIPDNLRKTLRTAISDLREKNAGVKWVRPESVHITLKFLGNINEDLIDPLARELDTAASFCPELNLSFSGFGVFPNSRRPRVIWVGLKGDTAQLGELASSIDRGCAKFGIKPEKRPFNAHITLGRLKAPSMIDLDINLIEEDFNATQVLFYKSELLPQGARYTVLHRSSFGHKGGK